jgi:uncharacterized OB-fold protein
MTQTSAATPGSPGPRRPLPDFPEPDTEPWWRATAEHRLLYQVSTGTGEVVFFPRRHSPHAAPPPGDPVGADLEWRESAGVGVVYSFTVIRQHGHPYFRSRIPYVVGFVDLDEGFRVLTEIVADPDAVRVGQRVRVEWEDVDREDVDRGGVERGDHHGLSVPVFRPLEQ